MSHFGSAVAWLVLVPLALTTNVVAVVVVCHYRQQFHGTDASLISLFAAMTLHAVLALPVAAGVELGGGGWAPELCSFYVWLLVCARVSELLTTGVMNIHWMCILRFTSGQEVYSSAFVVKVCLCLAWFGGVVTGLVPVTGIGVFSYFQESAEGGSGGECSFLPEGLGLPFVAFFFIMTLVTAVLSLVASADTLAVFRYMRRTAVEKYKAGRFYLPSSSAVFSTTPAGGRSDPRRGGASGWRHGEAGCGGARTGVDDEDTNGGGSSGVITDGRTSNGRLANGEGHGHPAGRNALLPGNAQKTVAPASGRGGMSRNAAEDRKGRGTVAPPASSAATIVVRPPATSGVARSGPVTVHAKYNELSLSSELCRVVVCFTLLTILVHHLPFAVLQFVQLLQPVDRRTAEVVVLWLLLLEALCTPHVLWLLSRRYRHALGYVWTVHVRRDESAKEEDLSACTLQSYMRRVQTADGATLQVIARARRGMGTSPPAQGHPSNGSIGGRLREADASLVPDGDLYDFRSAARRNTEIITTDLDDDLTVITDLASRKARYIYHSSASDAAGSSKGDDSQREATKHQAEASDSSRKDSEPTSPSRLSVGSPARAFDVPRTGSARQMWKEQMRKKHLPAAFVNEAFDAEEVADPNGPSADLRGWGLAGQVDTHMLLDVAGVANSDDGEDVDSVSDGAGAAADVLQSSDDRGPPYRASSRFPYHQQDLRSDSWPRPRCLVESESDGSSFQYDDKDIEVILDREQHSLQSASRRSVLERVMETESSGEAIHFRERHAARGMGSGVECSPLGREDSDVSSNDSSEGSGADKQSTRGHIAVREPPRRSSLVDARSCRPSSRQDQKHVDLAFRNDYTHADKNKASTVKTLLEDAETEYLSWGTEHLKHNADVASRDSDVSAELQKSERLGSFEKEKQVEQVQPGENSSKTKSPVGVRSDGPAFASVVVNGNDVTVQNVTCEESDMRRSAVTSHAVVFGTSEEGFNGVFLTTGRGGIADVEFDEVKPQNPRTRTEVLDDDFDDVQGCVETSQISASQTNSRIAGDISRVPTSTLHGVRQFGIAKTSNLYDSGRGRRNFDFSYDNDVGEPMIIMVNDGANLPDTAIVLDVLETSSTGSEHSIVLEPYHENRRPPWMDRAYTDDDELTPRSADFSAVNHFPVSSFNSPFQDRNVQKDKSINRLEGSFSTFRVPGRDSYDLLNAVRKDSLRTGSSSGYYVHDAVSSESDTDTPQSSGSSDQLRFLRNVTSDLSDPVVFEEATDRRFENALFVNYNIAAPSYYSSFPGVYFESIQEEPEDFSDSSMSEHRDEDRSTSKKDSSQSPSAGSASPMGTDPFLASGGSTYKTRFGLSRSSSGHSDDNVSDRHARTSADGKEASDQEVSSPQTTENLKPEDQILYVNDTAVDWTSFRTTYPDTALLPKARLWMDSKVNGVRSFSKDVRPNIDVSQSALMSPSQDDAAEARDAKNDDPPKRKPPLPPRRSSIGSDGVEPDSERRTPLSVTVHVEPVYF